MPSTHLCLHVHVIFSTKDRLPIIDAGFRDRLHAYLGGAARTVDAVPVAVGGTEDHVHLLLGLRATHRLADVVREVKHSSSEWVHDEIGMRAFAWQQGFGGFTVSPKDVRPVVAYIQNQAEHHRHRTFQEEYRQFLDDYGVEYDERYLW